MPHISNFAPVVDVAAHVALFSISLKSFMKIHCQYVRDAVLDVCAKSGPV